MLNHGALSGENGALDRIGGAATRGRAQQYGRQHRGRGQQSFMTLVDDLAHDMALSDVRGFVRQHACQFVFVARHQYQAAVDDYEPARDRLGVDVWVADDEVIELVLAFLRLAREAMTNFLSILADFRVREDESGLANLINER